MPVLQKPNWVGLLMVNIVSINESLVKFWELKEIENNHGGGHAQNRTEDYFKTNFTETHKRDIDSCVIVCIPFKDISTWTGEIGKTWIKEYIKFMSE